MKLSDLFLNRFLYKDTSQNLETKDSEFVSADSTTPDPAGIPSGGAAQDINTGNVTINGGQLTPGTYPQTTLDVSNWGWGQTCAFTVPSATQVNWSSGTFTSADGTSYSISAGNTGTMSAKTYIYLDLNVSSTAYQKTTTSSTSVGVGKVLIAVAQNDAVLGVKATYNLSEASQIVGDNILANTIDASKITTGQLVVGTNVGQGTAVTSGGVTTIIGNTVTTGYVNALSITAYDFSATNISGKTITGSTLQTGTSGFNVYITAAEIQIRNNSSVLATWGEDGFGYGTAELSTNAIIASVVNASTMQNISGQLSITGYPLVLSGQAGIVYCASNFRPYSDSSYDLGSSSYKWNSLYVNSITASGAINPSSNLSYGLGTASYSWSQIYCYDVYKSNHGGWGFSSFDEGVELQDGEKVSDVESFLRLEPDTSRPKSKHGTYVIKSSTLPKAVHRPAQEEGEEDSEDIFAMMSIMIGAIKELGTRLKELENKVK